MSKQPWISGTTTATCGKGKDHGDVMAPGDDCSCGLYAAKRTEEGFKLLMNSWFAKLRTLDAVMGEVRLWGKIVPAERGYRAQHGRVVGFYRTWPFNMDNPAWLDSLIGRFKVPLLELPDDLAHPSKGRLLYDSSFGRKLGDTKRRRYVAGKPRHGKTYVAGSDPDFQREYYGHYVYHKSGQDIEMCGCANCQNTPNSPGIKDFNGDCLDKPKPVSSPSLGMMKAPPDDDSDDFLSLKSILSMRKKELERYDRLHDVLDKMKEIK